MPQGETIPAVEEAKRVLKELERLERELEFVILAERRPPSKKAKKPPKKIRQFLRRKWERAGAAGSIAQMRVSRLLRILEEQGKVLWFTESEKHDIHDRLGIDQYGRLAPQCGGVAFRIDSKSSDRRIKPHQGFMSLIFIPRQIASDEGEAKRLLVEIQKRFVLKGGS